MTVNKMTRRRQPVKYRNANEWPSWTDQVRYVPTDDDQATNAAMNTAWDDDGPAADDPVWDEWAAEAKVASQLEAGLRMF